MREEVRERVAAIAKSLGYAGPDPKGRLLRAGRFNAVGVVVFDALPYFFEDPYARRFMAGIAEACDARGAGLSLVSAANDEVAAWTIRSALVDGFVLNCLAEGSRLVDLAIARGIPFVAIDYEPAPGIDVVNIDDRAGAQLAAEHLLGLGHRRFGILSLDIDVAGRVGFADGARLAGVQYGPTRDRIRGYRDALGAAGLDAEAVPIFETMNTAQEAALGVDAILALQPDTTAFLGMSDILALGAIDRLQARGLAVPGDASVVGFDDIPDGAVSRPPLTTIAQPIAERARIAIEMIFGDPALRGTRAVTLPLSLVVRGSTAAPQ